jgi:hypothetical protein
MYIILCLEETTEGKVYPLAATKRKFRTLEEAEGYAATIDDSRSASVIDLSIFEDRG